MRRTNIYLEDRQTDALDALAHRRHVTRSVLVRRLIDDGLAAAAEDVHDDLDAIDSSFGVLADDRVEDTNRTVSVRDEYLESLWAS